MTDTTMSFHATGALYDIRQGTREARLSSSMPGPSYLALRRCLSPGNPVDTEGGREEHIQVELNNSARNGYDRIQDCYLDRRQLRLKLDPPIDGKAEITVSLDIDEAAFERFLEGLKQVFAHQYHLLHLADTLTTQAPKH